MQKGLFLKSHLAHLWSRVVLFQEASRNDPKMCNRNTVLGEMNQMLPLQVGLTLAGPMVGGRQRRARSEQRPYLLVVFFGPQGHLQVHGGGRIDGWTVLRAVVIALAHAWESGKQKGLLGWTGPQGQCHMFSVTCVRRASFNFLLTPLTLNKHEMYLFCFAYFNYNKCHHTYINSSQSWIIPDAL